jgi:tetratricopeptide (TPR) repeat protein
MYHQALKLQENFVSSRFHLGLMYHKTNQFQEALKCFSKVLLKIPNDKTVYIARGVVYQDMGNHQLAIKDFNRSIEIDPELSEGYYRRGFSKLASKSFHDAIEDFKKSEEHEDPEEEKKNAGIPDGLACCYHALKDFD